MNVYLNIVHNWHVIWPCRRNNLHHLPSLGKIVRGIGESEISAHLILQSIHRPPRWPSKTPSNGDRCQCTIGPLQQLILYEPPPLQTNCKSSRYTKPLPLKPCAGAAINKGHFISRSFVPSHSLNLYLSYIIFHQRLLKTSLIHLN